MSLKISNVLYASYKAKGYVKATPMFHEELRFQFRPFRAIERADVLQKLKSLDAGKYVEALMAVVLSRLTDWELQDDQGRTYAVSKESVMDLPVLLWQKLSNIVLGLDPSEVDPKWSEVETEEFDQAAFEAELTGKPLADVQEDNRLKN